MGICFAKKTPEDIKNRELDREIRKKAQSQEDIHKLLLLGAGESGKSTLFKQMRFLYGVDHFSEAKKKEYGPIIANNVVLSAQNLIDACKNHTELQTEEAKAGAELIYELDENTDINEERLEALKALWADPGLQATFECRSQFHIVLNDSCQWFFDKLDTIGAPGYIPTVPDILRARVRTTGIVEQLFEIDENKFSIYDVGGQRSERHKWIHCFQGVTAVLFIAALSEFDQKLYEDNKTNRMVEALNLFEEIANSNWFEKSSMILFLNKVDLFQEKKSKRCRSMCASVSTPALMTTRAPQTSLLSNSSSEEPLTRTPTRKSRTSLCITPRPQTVKMLTEY